MLEFNKVMIKRVLFIGSKKLGISVLQAIYKASSELLVGAITLNDTDDKRSVYDEFSAFAKQTGVPTDVANKNDSVDKLLYKYDPDWCIVCGWYRIIGARTLARVPNGFAGIHASLLPQFRGSAPLVWAMIQGVPKVGVSLFKFGPGIDDGPIYFQCEYDVTEDDDIGTVSAKIEHLVVEKLAGQYMRIISGELLPLEQNAGLASYCAPRQPDDGKIDWSQGAASVHNFVRAQSHPYPGAFTFSGYEKIYIWRSEVAREPHFAQPGQMIRKDDRSIFIGCADGTALRVLCASVNGVDINPAQILRSFADRLT